jgi:hypothetical protein
MTELISDDEQSLLSAHPIAALFIGLQQHNPGKIFIYFNRKEKTPLLAVQI